MGEDEKRAARIIAAANLAISKMTDPAKRGAAKAKLQQVQKKIALATQQPGAQTIPAQQSRDRDFDR